MAGERNANIKLGGFVLAGTVVLLLGLYLLGSKRDLFSDTMDVQATFREVNGLRSGNNVRFAGIDVGTVKDLVIESDTVVIVRMVIRMNAAQHIRSNAVARIGSDGMMGNKLVSLEQGEGEAPPIADGAVLHGGAPLDTDAMLRTLGRSNDNLADITTDLRDLAHRLNTDNGLLRLLEDSLLVTDVQHTIRELYSTASNAREITERVNSVVIDVQQGEGALGLLVKDPATEEQVHSMLLNLSAVSDSLTSIAGNINRFSAGLNDPEGLGYTLSRDTATTGDVKRVIARLDSSAATLNEDLRALQSNWFFRRYFKAKKKAQEKEERSK